MSDDRKTELNDAALDVLFAQAREAEPEGLPDGFAALLLGDAVAAIPVAPQRGIWARLGAALADLGGAPGLAGVGAAGLAGVWIGFAGPGVTGDLVSQVWQEAATLSPTVSGWVDDGSLSDTGGTLLSLMSGEAE